MKLSLETEASILVAAGATLGEGPVWYRETGELFWVDIEGCRLSSVQPGSLRQRNWQFDGMVGAVIPTKGKNFILAHEKGLLRFNPVNGKTEPLQLLVNEDPRLRFNDGKCGPDGNLWIGTMDKELAAGAGNLYKIEKNLQVSTVLSGTSVSNGMAWTRDHKYYYIDSATFEVWKFDYHPETAEIYNKEVAIRIPEDHGAADGMCIDLEGKLWIAHWGGNCVRRWDPDSGRVIGRISVKAPHVTSCCFGGETMNTLYITTARSGLSKQELEEFPLSGGLFYCELPVQGDTVPYFDLNL